MAKAKAGKKAAPKSAASTETLLIASKVRGVVKDAGFNFAGDALAGLNAQVHELLQRAIRRTDSNGRKTVRASDF
jgi:hypothetical protein